MTQNITQTLLSTLFTSPSLKVWAGALPDPLLTLQILAGTTTQGSEAKCAWQIGRVDVCLGMPCLYAPI